MTAKGSGSRYRVCEVCSADYHATYTAQRTCGRACGTKARGYRPRTFGPSNKLNWHQCSECPAWMGKRGRVVCSPRCAKARSRRRWYATWVSAAKPTTLPCRECGRPHSTLTANNCGWCARCRSNANKTYRRRARHHRVEYEPVNRLRVYERDHWTCQICRRKVNRTAPPPSDRYPTLDHVIPMALGGPHSYANVQLACRQCNTRKGVRGGNEQLALAG